MKSLLLILLTISLSFSSEKKIILGSYVQEMNSSNTLNQVQQIIQEDEGIKKLIELNQLTVQVEKIGEYNVVSVKPFTDYVQLLRTMKAFRLYYSDLYVLPPYQAVSNIETITLTLEPKKVVAEQTEVKQEKKVLVAETKKFEKKLAVEESTISKAAPAIENDLIEQEEVLDHKTIFNKQIIITIAIAFILLLILIGIIIKVSRKRYL